MHIPARINYLRNARHRCTTTAERLLCQPTLAALALHNEMILLLVRAAGRNAQVAGGGASDCSRAL